MNFIHLNLVMKKYIIYLFLFFPFISNSQVLKGLVFGNDENGKQTLPGVNIFWQGTNDGVATKGDGTFEIEKKSTQHMLVLALLDMSRK